jgi:hypothetical protein
MEILFRDEDSYIVRKGGMYYLVRPGKPVYLKREYLESITKFGGDWERVETVEDSIREELEKRIAEESK